MPETIAFYREQNVAFCLFTVDSESGIGAKRLSNYEIADIAAEHDDIVIPFASIDPRRASSARARRATWSRTTASRASSSTASSRTSTPPTASPGRSTK
ncbi:MAG: hypothetical protein WDN24_17450 [Sphingomonas sp.]